jgi:NAD(P)-dependent dehydrogenase (short-subunit alcohol dehydrogenase family)
MPVQGAYSAASHAVKGFTSALRMELMRTNPKISVTLIKPSALDTPYALHARNFTGHPATQPPPVYDPALAVDAILYAAEHRTREITVGGGGRAMALFGQFLPALAEPLYAFLAPALTRGTAAERPEEAPRRLSERAGTFAMVRRTSLWTRAQLNPEITAAAVAGAALGLWLTLGAKRGLEIAHAKHEVRLREREKHRAREAKILARSRREGTRKPA